MAKAGAGFHQCVTAVETAAGRELSETELDEVFSRIQGRIRRYQAEGHTPTAAAVRAGKELGEQMRMAGLIEKRNRLINVARRREIEGRLRVGHENADLKAMLTGRESAKAGDAQSIDAMSRGLHGQLFGPMVYALRKAGLTRVLGRGDKAFDRDVIRELWSITSDEGPVTKNSAARKAAEIINEAQEAGRLMQNKAGAWIGKLDQYVTRQTHDMHKIRNAGFEAWRDFIRDKLDARTFDHMDEITPEGVEKFLRETFNSLQTGVHDVARGNTKYGDVGSGTGPANLAKRASAERKLLFKDADAWADYAEVYGKGSLMEIVRGTLENAARNTALMRVLGPNPEAMYEHIVQRAMSRAKDRGDTKAVDALRESWNGRILDVLTGKASVPGNATLAKYTVLAQAFQTLTKLGGVVVASMPDLAVNAAMLRHNGVGLIESYGNQLRSLLPKGTAGREVADLASVGIDGMLGEIASRHSALDAASGTAARAVETFHKLNLLSWWTDSMKFGLGTMLTHNLGRLSTKSFDQLPARLRVTLSRYGIEAAEWNAARKAAVKAADGRMHILPPHIEDEALRTKFSTYIQDQVSEGMTEPDAASRAYATWGLRAGTPEGMAARLIMQFKQYPITFMRRSLGREMNRKDGMDVAGLAHLIVGTTVLGYVAMEMKAAARGRETVTQQALEGDLTTGHAAGALIRAMAQGGGLGFYGDALFGQTKDPVYGMLGPTVGTLNSLGETIGNLRKWITEGDPRAGKDARSGALGLVKDNAPFINMFYTRAILDYFVWYRLQEWMNPGYLKRYEDRMKQEHGTEFMISPTASPYR
jgi:hypothetical protein